MNEDLKQSLSKHTEIDEAAEAYEYQEEPVGEKEYINRGNISEHSVH